MLILIVALNEITSGAEIKNLSKGHNPRRIGLRKRKIIPSPAAPIEAFVEMEPRIDNVILEDAGDEELTNNHVDVDQSPMESWEHYLFENPMFVQLASLAGDEVRSKAIAQTVTKYVYDNYLQDYVEVLREALIMERQSIAEENRGSRGDDEK